MINMLHRMGVKSGMMYTAGIASIGLSFASWLTSKNVENASLARADRWGIFIGEWAPTFFAMGLALRIEETHSDNTRLTEREMFDSTYAEGRMPSHARM
ncbi:hypothetical protein [Planobispora longispora]|uniref:Uncharacterized protein n=1 Tax=Planobispora longispora TaxID=28887 RepID=A0A8J3RFI0_9ACTN|nr:hypothetical protein [Planobispora longispora]BFE77825.1 hypothetical protein GCM10020093_004260 [Planobispora longispora]GIH73755.1 hypothetical protein Plo01_01840 [Planobispora longispora]